MERWQSGLMLAGRVLMSLIFISGGWAKLLAATATQAGFAQRGLPLPAVVWVIAVVIELGGGIALLLGLYTRFVGAVLGFWCLATALVAHTNLADRNQEIHFFKNLAMAGGFLYVAAFGAGVYSLDRWRIRYRLPS